MTTIKNLPLIDLHTHSTASDGTDTPTELMRKAADMGLAAIALTDHDVLAGLTEAEAAARKLNLEFIRGCEISTRTDSDSVHILGLWIPAACSGLDASLRDLRIARHNRNVQVIEKLNKAGIKITLEEVANRAHGVLGRPHIAAAMVEKGYVKNKDEAFKEWLGAGGKVWVPKQAPTPEEAVRMLVECGAAPIIAHPLLHSKSPEWLEDLISRLKPLGLFGLEAWHSAQSPEQSREIIKLANKYDLGLSGGSDYHGLNKPGINLATGKNNLAVNADVLEKLKARRKAQGMPC